MESKERVVSSLLDTLFPTINDSELNHRDERIDAAQLQRFYEFKGSQCDGLAAKASAPRRVLELIDTRLSNDDKNQLNTLLWLLSTRWGTFLLLGRDSLCNFFPCAFPDLPVTNRERALLGWARSPMRQLRKAFVGLKGLLLSSLSTWLDPSGASPVLQTLGYDITDPLRPASVLPDAQRAENAIAARLLDISATDSSKEGASRIAAALASKGLRVSWPEEFWSASPSFSEAIIKENPTFIVQCDAVIVGSGAGGGVAAARLAAAGLKVVVLEKASFVPASKMSLKEGESMQEMYESSGLLTTESGATTVLAGSTVGGGTRINWNASFKTPSHVRKEWAEEYGLTQFSSDEYDTALDAVWLRLGVRTGFIHNAMCSALGNGLEAAGLHCGDVARNCSDPSCSGHCCFGCARGAKKDVVNTFLGDACADGAWVVTGAWVERIITEKLSPETKLQQPGGGQLQHQQQRQVTGVVVTATSPAPGCPPLRFVFAAPLVLSCAGAIHTPALLLRSGITSGGNVGSNLRLHPCACITGTFPPDHPIRCWEGPLMSKFSSAAGDWEGSGYGALLYTPAAHPGLFAAAAPWHGGRAFKDLILDFPNAVAVLILVRDRGSGRVRIDKSGMPRLNYPLAQEDRVTMCSAMQLGLTALAAAGASSVMTLHSAPQADGRPLRYELKPNWNAKDLEFQEFLGKVERAGVPDLGMPTFSAHQMGSCRLGVDPSTSVLDSKGECWEVSGLYGCDASVFPTPTGVNPMITVEAVSYMLAGGIAARAVAGASVPPGA